MNPNNEAGGTQDTTPTPMEDAEVQKPRTWKEGGPKIQNVKIKTLYDTGNKMVTLQFEDELGPVFRATFERIPLRELIDNIYNALLEIDLDEAKKARNVDQK